VILRPLRLGPRQASALLGCGVHAHRDGGYDASGLFCHNDPVGPPYCCIDQTTWIAHDWVTRCGGVITNGGFPCDGQCTSDLEDIGSPHACLGMACVNAMFLTSVPWPETPCVGGALDASDDGPTDASDVSDASDATKATDASDATDVRPEAGADASGP
jgi:hypothetical protein